jgi:hypothetical protein
MKRLRNKTTGEVMGWSEALESANRNLEVFDDGQQEDEDKVERKEFHKLRLQYEDGALDVKPSDLSGDDLRENDSTPAQIREQLKATYRLDPEDPTATVGLDLDIEKLSDPRHVIPGTRDPRGQIAKEEVEESSYGKLRQAMGARVEKDARLQEERERAAEEAETVVRRGRRPRGSSRGGSHDTGEGGVPPTAQ